MKKNRRECLIGILLCMLWVLNGCQLAKENAAAKDLLVGALITKEPLVLAEGKQYGETDNETGLKEQEKYVFKGLDGILFYAVPIKNSKGEPTDTLGGDDEICNLHLNFSKSDAGEIKSLEGTVYLDHKEKDNLFYMNPVYQETNGKVYVKAGEGIAFRNESGGAESCSTSIFGKVEVKENKKISQNRSEIKVTFQKKSAMKKINVLEMSPQHKVLSKVSYVPEEFPKEWKPLSKTAYLVVESYDGENKAHYDIYDKENQEIKIYHGTDKGYCVEECTELIWE